MSRDAFVKLALVQVFAKFIMHMDTDQPLHNALSVGVTCNIEGAEFEIKVKRKKQPKAKMIPKPASGS